MGVSVLDIDRRRLIAATAGGAAAVTAITPARADAQPTAFGLDAARLGVHPDRRDDQSRTLQRAIDQAAQARVPLLIPPGTYCAGELKLPAHAKLIGVRGATRIALSTGGWLMAGRNADHIELTGLSLDGGNKPLPTRHGLVEITRARGVRVTDCEIFDAGGHAIALNQTAGEISSNTVTAAAGTAIFTLDAQGLAISANTIRKTGNNGIQVWRSTIGDDGTLVTDNRIEETQARSGGSGQNGNAINVFRAGNVIVRGNRMRGAVFSAVRGNAASNLQIVGNICSAVGEVALYAEFGFEGAVIANNTVDGAAIGVSVTNFKEGGRLAVVQGNLVRNLIRHEARDENGIGIHVEADTVVNGNVIENAPGIGISAGWGPYLRDVAITDNVVRDAGIAIAVSVAEGAGAALITDNLIASARAGAVVGMAWKKRMTGDLTRDGASRYVQLTVGGNRVR
jgi:uncharacterized secreted repeat protein (TIGR03808 family)